jgi:glutathione S-transferase
MMSDLILHHYPNSPFAEKIRAVLGYKQLAWQGVHIPMMMPKPDVVALTGGHRRTPLLQRGADVFCDTAIICEEIDHLKPEPTLYPKGQEGLTRIVAQWADDLVFGPAMAYNFQPSGAAEMFAGADPEWVKAFVEDRKAMRGGAPRMLPADATPTYQSYLRRLSSQLESHPFVLGEQPSLADFAAYHPVWFTMFRTPSLAGLLDATPRVREWAQRMAAFGNGQETRIESSQALDIARQSQPRDLSGEAFVDHHGIARGETVSIKAVSFGLEVSVGELVAATKTRYVIRHTDERAGTVQVHFPRVGFVMSREAS